MDEINAVEFGFSGDVFFDSDKNIILGFFNLISYILYFYLF